jgi:hypothetical protein
MKTTRRAFLQTGGRFAQSVDFDFMMPMGIWCENFALPGVLNECMMQSYSGTIRLFPNTTNLGPARFEDLRAVGAFLVSASYDGQKVTDCTLTSEKGRRVQIISPWPDRELRVIRTRDNSRIQPHAEGEGWTFDTEAGGSYRIMPA